MKYDNHENMIPKQLCSYQLSLITPAVCHKFKNHQDDKLCCFEATIERSCYYSFADNFVLFARIHSYFNYDVRQQQLRSLSQC